MHRILVTGSAGGFGGALTEYLSLKSLEKKEKSSTATTFNVVGNYDDRENWEGALKGVDTVVHLSALAHKEKSDPKAFLKNNIETTEKLFLAATKAGVKHFIFISSIRAVADSAPSPISETDVSNPKSLYGKSKAKGEQLLYSLAERESAPAVTIIRAPIVFGKDIPSSIKTILSWCKALPFLPFAGFSQQKSFLSQGLFLRILETIIENPNLQGVQVFHAANRGTLSISEIIEIYNTLLPTPKLSFGLPNGIIFFLALFIKKLTQLNSSLVMNTERLQAAFPSLEVKNVESEMREYLISLIG